MILPWPNCGKGSTFEVSTRGVWREPTFYLDESEKNEKNEHGASTRAWQQKGAVSAHTISPRQNAFRGAFSMIKWNVFYKFKEHA